MHKTLNSLVPFYMYLINMLNAVSVLEKSIEPSQYKTLYHKGGPGK